MEAAAVPLCPILRSNPIRPLTSTGHKPTINSHRHGLRFFHRRTSLSDGHPHVIGAANALGMNSGDGGKVARDPDSALASFLDSCQSESTVKEAEKQFEEIVAQYDQILKMKRDVDMMNNLKKHARTLEMSAEVDIAAAIQKLRGLYEELKREDNRGHMPFGEATYNVGLLLAEMLIYQEEYQEAKAVVKECDGKLPPDVTPKLYQSVICLMEMMDREKEAETFWKDFDKHDMLSRGQPKVIDDHQETKDPAPTPPRTFQEFKEKMEKLREKITTRRKIKSSQK